MEILNLDWKANPYQINAKLNGQQKKLNCSQISGFQVGGRTFITREIEIDSSSNVLGKYSNNYGIESYLDSVFLEVLFDG